MSDRDIIRRLAYEYTGIASMDVQKEKAKLYRALNGLKPIRPVVLIDELPWSQLAVMDELKEQCVGDRERAVECYFRRELYRWKHFPCDRILVDFFPWPKHVAIGSFGIDVQEDTLAIDSGNNIVSHAYKDQISNEKDIEKLHVPEITVNQEADAGDLEWLTGLIGDILPIRLTGLEYAGFYEPWDNIAQWRGVEPLLWDLADRPEFLHSLINKILEVRLELLSHIEDLNLLDNSSPFLHSTAGLCDELPGDIKGEILLRENIWGRGAAQIFASVSPGMTDEFEIQYARRFFEGFGLLYYGCCEPLHQKIGIVKQLPNLRKISVTPWADVNIASEKIGSDFVMANKPNPAFLAVSSINEDAVRAEIDGALTACRRNNTPVEFTLKDISSVNGHPENIDQWAKIVMEMVESTAT